MKLLLTSNGFMNKSIVEALQKMVNRPLSELRIAFIPTAANLTEGNKTWYIDILINIKKVGFASFDIVDISALPQSNWQPRLENSDILLFCGGNSFHLLYWLKKSGLINLLPTLLQKRIYVGISAGSIIATKNLMMSNNKKRLLAEKIGEHVQDDDTLGYANFLVRPHLNDSHFPHAKKEILEKRAQETKETIYGIDDETAIQIINDKVTVISEGEWVKFN